MRQKQKRKASRARIIAEAKRTSDIATAVAFATPYGDLCRNCATVQGTKAIPSHFHPIRSFAYHYTSSDNPEPIRCCNCGATMGYSTPEEPEII